MKKYITISADYNDGDYISENIPITDEQIELIKPVIAQLKMRRDKLNEDRDLNWNEWRHNWETCERPRLGDPSKMYVVTGLLTQKQVDLFNKFVPYGEYGVHTIDSIEIVTQGEKLF